MGLAVTKHRLKATLGPKLSCDDRSTALLQFLEMPQCTTLISTIRTPQEAHDPRKSVQPVSRVHSRETSAVMNLPFLLCPGHGPIGLQFTRGTTCDLTGVLRSSTVFLKCGKSKRVVEVVEDRTCHYRVVALSPLLCRCEFLPQTGGCGSSRLPHSVGRCSTTPRQVEEYKGCSRSWWSP